MPNPRFLPLLALAFTGACGSPADDPDATVGDDDDDDVPPQVSDCDDGPLDVAGGPVSGTWCDAVTVQGDISVPAGATLILEAGTQVTVAPGTRITVEGTLDLRGQAASPVRIDAGGDGWAGITVAGGNLVGQHADLHGRLAQLRMTGGTLELADSILDLDNDELSPDCTSISGGTVDLEHVWFTGCHCPIHISGADGVQIHGSQLDGAAVPVMIARTDGALNGNHFVGTSWGVEDVGGSLNVDLSGNYWGGGAPNVKTGNPAQFTGIDEWSASPLPGVGPRR